MGVWMLVGSLCLSAGCTVGPDYHPPNAGVSSAWKYPQEAESIRVGEHYGPWWSEFQDPVLDRLIQQAVMANPSLQEACYRVLESRARRGVVSGERLPQVDGLGSYSYKKISGNSSPYALTSQNAYSLFTTGFDASWELDFWGKYRRAIEAADAEICVADHERNAVLLMLLGDVATAYVELRTFQTRIGVALENVTIQERTLRLAQERYRAGLAKPLDAAQATRSLHATRATIPSLEIGLQRAENRLCVLLGEAPRVLRDQLGPTRPIPVAPREPALGVRADLLRRRPDVRSAELKVAAASARIGVAVADLYPQFSLTGTISVDATDVGSLLTPRSIAHKVGPSLTWDILNFGRVRNRIDAQEARFEQAVWFYRATALSAVEEVENALASYTQEQVRSKSLALAVEAAVESVRLAELYYGQGLASFQSVLDSQRSLLGLQDQRTVSLANTTLSRIALYKALGGGWEAVASGVRPIDNLSPAIVPEPIITPPIAQLLPPIIKESRHEVRRLPPLR